MIICNRFVGVDLCVYPHVANRTVLNCHTMGKHIKGRHIGLPLRGVANRTVPDCHTLQNIKIKPIPIPIPIKHKYVVGADLRVCPHVANRTVDYYHTMGKHIKGRHIGLPLRGVANRTVSDCHTLQNIQIKPIPMKHKYVVGGVMYV